MWSRGNKGVECVGKNAKENKGVLARKFAEKKMENSVEGVNKKMGKVRTELEKLVKLFSENHSEEVLHHEGLPSNIPKKKKTGRVKKRSYGLADTRSPTRASKAATETVRSADCTLKLEQLVGQPELSQMLVSLCGAVEGLVSEQKP